MKSRWLIVSKRATDASPVHAERYPDRESRDEALKMMRPDQQARAVDLEPGQIVRRGLSSYVFHIFTLEEALAETLKTSNGEWDEDPVAVLERKVDLLADTLARLIASQPSTAHLGLELLDGRFEVVS